MCKHNISHYYFLIIIINCNTVIHIIFHDVLERNEVSQSIAKEEITKADSTKENKWETILQMEKDKVIKLVNYDIFGLNS